MHQTFYIDIDEEITSIVERVRKARAKEIILVVPKGALLIQSVVNLRILKKEADETGLQLMVITQDKLGKMLVEKAGIFVQQKMDNISDEEVDIDEEKIGENYEMPNEKEESGKNRLDKIGSESYFKEPDPEETITAKPKRSANSTKKIEGEERENLINKELVSGMSDNLKKRSIAPAMDLKAVSSRSREFSPKADILSNIPNVSVLEKNATANFSQNNVACQNASLNPPQQDKKIENFFYSGESSGRKTPSPAKAKEDYKNYNLSGKVHRGFWFFGFIAILTIIFISAYLFIPKATVTVAVKLDVKEVDSEITGNIAAAASDFDKNIIPAKIVSASAEISKSYDASGSKLISNQKAHGKITIYNEYSSNPQPLVATTRFVSEGGKLFRLVKGVTIPGMESDGNPSSVSAEVMADESGDSYNIDPGKFSIPGFQSSGIKYEKIYAKSEQKMSGGGNGSVESRVITDGDIASAKGKIQVELNSAIREKIKNEAGGDTVILDGAMSGDEPEYKISNSADDVADSFQITVNTQAKAIVVNQKEINANAIYLLNKSLNGKTVDPDSLTLDFSRSNADLTNGVIDIKSNARGKVNSDINKDDLKKEILGKNEEALKSYLSQFGNVQEATVSYWPSVISGRIPFLSRQVKIILDKQ